MDAMYLHGKFPKGVPPQTLVAKKPCVYVPTREQAGALLAAHRAVATATRAELLWVVVESGGKLAPTGLALVTTKQITIQAKQAVHL